MDSSALMFNDNYDGRFFELYELALGKVPVSEETCLRRELLLGQDLVKLESQALE
jgi:hypothetical protein